MTVKNADYVKLVNATYRATGSIGPKAVVPKLVPGVAKKTDKILDFGAGTKAIHTMALRQQGYNVTAYDIGANFADIVKKGGTLIANYPPSPRKSGLAVAEVDALLRMKFATVARVPGISSPTWICRK